MTKDWQGKHALILGAARQGLALARYLTKHGASVTVNDKRMPYELEDEQKALQNFDVEWVLGTHFSSLLNGKDVVFLSGGIPLDLPIVRDAQRRKIPLSNDTQLFLEVAPCRTIGITGSAGKTTTTTLVGRMAKEAFKAEEGKVWVGGNIGDPLLNYVDEMTENDLAILEISSFQLDQMTLSTDIAAVLNVTPNHLDRHGTMEAYAAAKARLLSLRADSFRSVASPSPRTNRAFIRWKITSISAINGWTSRSSRWNPSTYAVNIICKMRWLLLRLVL